MPTEHRFNAGDTVPEWVQKPSGDELEFIRFDVDALVRQHDDGTIRVYPVIPLEEGQYVIHAKALKPNSHVVLTGAPTEIHAKPVDAD